MQIRPDDRRVVELENGTQIDASIDQRLLEGAPLHMNEMMFYHKVRGTTALEWGEEGGQERGYR